MLRGWPPFLDYNARIRKANLRRALERKLAEAIDGHSATHSHNHIHHSGLCVGFGELVCDFGPAEFRVHLMMN